MGYLKYIFLFLAIHSATVTSKYVKFYRKDYQYISEYDAFYKIHHHADGVSWQTAFQTCENETAQLFYPSEDGEWTIADKLRMEKGHTPTDVMIGVHNQFNVGEFMTIDGRSPPPSLGPLPHVEEGDVCVIMNSTLGNYTNTNCTTQWPTLFVCKKRDIELCPTTSCPTIDTDYTYYPGTRKCYKVNYNAKKWKDAMKICYLEGGLLAPVKDQTVMIFLSDILNLNLFNTYFIGVRDQFNNGEYYTVGGKHVGAIPLHVDQGPQHDRSKREILYDFELMDLMPTEMSLPENYDTTSVDATQVLLKLPVNHSLEAPYSCGILTYQNDEATVKATSCHTEMPFICEMETGKIPN